MTAPAFPVWARAGHRVESWARLAAFGLSAAILLVGGAVLLTKADVIAAHGGEDFGIYLRHAREWLAGGSFYDARQLTGQPYSLAQGDSLYPPTFALFMVP